MQTSSAITGMPESTGTYSSKPLSTSCLCFQPPAINSNALSSTRQSSSQSLPISQDALHVAIAKPTAVSRFQVIYMTVLQILSLVIPPSFGYPLISFQNSQLHLQ